MGEVKKVNVSYFINAAISIAIMLLFGFLPPFGAMTPTGMSVLGIFIGVIWGWIGCEMIWPSILAFILLGFTGTFDTSTAVIDTFMGNTTVVMIIYMMAFSAVIIVSGLSREIATRLINSKFCQGRTWVLSIILFIVCWLISAFISYIAVLVMWDFVYNIAKQIGYTKKDKWVPMMLVGIAFASCIGSNLLPFAAMVIGLMGVLASASQGVFATYNFAAYFLFSIIIGLASCAVYFIICKFVLRPDLSKLKEYKVPGYEKKPFDTRQKLAIFALVAIMVLTIVPSMFPEGALRTFANTFGATAFILLITGLLVFFRNKEGKPYFTFQELASSGILWNIVFMIGVAMVMGSVLTGSGIGLKETIVGMMMPVFSSSGAIVFVVAIIVLAIVLTNVLNNIIVGMIMITIVCSFASALGLNALAMTAVIIYASGIGMILPSGSPVGAMMYANTEWLDRSGIVKYTLISMVSAVLVAVVIGFPLGIALFV